ncbi:MAG: hypothetical protein AB7K68_05195 [Bacteriovoracia bacterium]
MKRDALCLSIAAAFLFLIEALAWPLAAGRDGHSYLYYAYDFFSLVPEDRFTMLFRTPMAPFFDFILLTYLPPWGAELAMGALFVALILSLYRIGLFWGRKVGLFFAGLFLFHFGWGSLFHVVSNDPPLAILAPLLLWATLASVKTQRPIRFFLVGLLVGLFTLTRPGIFPALGLLPIFLWNFSWPKKLVSVCAFYMACLPILLAWSFWNYSHYGFFSMAPGANVVLPLGRVLAQEQILREENGPNSAELAKAVREFILQPIGSTQDANEYFLSHPRYFEYMLLADKAWGTGNYTILQKAAWEAVAAQPGKYFCGVAKTILLSMAGNLKQPVPLQSGARVHTHKGHVSYTLDTQDQWIPLKEFNFSAPLGGDGISGVMAKLGPNSLRAWNFMRSFPKRDGWIQVGTILNWMAYLFPPILLWLLAVLLWPIRKKKIAPLEIGLLYFWLLCLATNVLASFSIWSVIYEYRLPFDPVYVLTGGLAFLHRFWPKALEDTPNAS